MVFRKELAGNVTLANRQQSERRNGSGDSPQAELEAAHSRRPASELFPYYDFFTKGKTYFITIVQVILFIRLYPFSVYKSAVG